MEQPVFAGPVNAGNITVIQGDNHGELKNEAKIGTQGQLSDADYISNIISSNEEKVFVKNCKEADAYFENKNKQELQSLIDEVVKKNIDSQEKKTGFLNKVKQFGFNIATSLVGGLLLQAVKNVIFGS